MYRSDEKNEYKNNGKRNKEEVRNQEDVFRFQFGGKSGQKTTHLNPRTHTTDLQQKHY
jgi:hypothetical protein